MNHCWLGHVAVCFSYFWSRQITMYYYCVNHSVIYLFHPSYLWTVGGNLASELLKPFATDLGSSENCACFLSLPFTRRNGMQLCRLWHKISMTWSWTVEWLNHVGKVGRAWIYSTPCQNPLQTNRPIIPLWLHHIINGPEQAPTMWQLLFRPTQWKAFPRQRKTPDKNADRHCIPPIVFCPYSRGSQRSAQHISPTAFK